MKHKFKIKRIETPNDNDCWAIALSQALKVDYDVIYKQFKHMMFDDNSVDNSIVRGYLKKDGYTVVTTSLGLIDAIRVYDRKGGIIFAMKNSYGEHHIVYIEDNTIYESDICTDDMLWWYIKEHEVIWIAKKLNGFV